ncbi:MAG: eukaryotic-like serine/threonine-protein kinase [Bradyrhizobium sp.]|nr:eukaryotic-like serine/threonine-protein kinase [Bradyrhizobium sp.]
MRDDQGIHTIRLFVSSPGDVAVERERVDHVATRLNEVFKDRIRIETIRWEKDFYSSHQHFADKIPLATDADLVIAIFWSRLGTPLPVKFGRMDNGERYPSGTAYEVLTAIDARRKNDHPDVYVFRKDDAPADSSEEAKAQWKDLNSFFSRWFRAPDGQFLRAFHQFETADEFERLIDRLLRKWIAERVPRDRSVIWPIEVKGSPFRGLEPFDASHSAIYFGRDRKVTRAIEQLQSVAKPQNAIRSAPRSIPFLLIVGESGAGKSSLMRAGLAPRLTAPGVVPAVGLWRMAIVRIGDDPDPFLSLAKALLVTNDEAGGFGAALPELADGGWTVESLCELLAKGGETGPRKRAPAAAPVLAALAQVQADEMIRRGTRRRLRANLLLLVDQLENIFAANITDQQRAAFARLLFALCASRRVWAVATIRSDIYPHLITPGDFLALKDVGGVYDLAAPSESELTEIVHKSAAAAGLVYEPDEETGERLDERILLDAQGKNTLPLLEFALEQLFKRLKLVEIEATDHAPGRIERRLTFAAYNAMQRLDGAINQSAENALGELGNAELDALPRLLRCLAVPVDDQGSATARGGGLTVRVVPRSAAVPDDATARLVKALTKARIIVATGSDDEEEIDRKPLIGISHQRVFESWGRARRIIAEAESFFRVRQEVETRRQRWEKNKRPELLLAKGVPLAEAQELLRGFGDELDDATRSYIAASNRRAQRWNVFVRTAAVVFGVLFLGAAALGVMAWVAQKSASANYEVAKGAVNDLTTEMTKVLGDVEGIRVSVVQNVLSIVDRTIQKVQGVSAGDPQVARIRAEMLFQGAKAFQKKEDLVQAREAATASLEIRRKLARYDEWPSAPAVARSIPQQWRWDLSRSLELSGDLDRLAQKYGTTRLQFVNTLAIRSQLYDEASDNEEWAKGVSQIHTRIGDIDIAANPAEALQHYQSALTIAARFFSRNRNDDPWQRELSWAFNKIGDVHRKRAEIAAATGDGAARKTELVAALEAYDSSLCLRRGISRRDPGKTELIRDNSYSLDRIAATKFALEDPAGAETAYFESLQIRRKLVNSVKDNGLYLGDVGASLQLIGEYYLARAELANAVAFHGAAADVRTEALLRLPGDPRTQQNAEKAGRTAQSVRERAAAQEPEADLSGARLRKLIEDVEATQAARIAAAGSRPQDCWDKVVAAADLIATPSTTGSIPSR